jgi:DNA-directed RNA polymerase specialized sigma24 family protein
VDIESALELEALVAALRTLPQVTQRVFVLRKVYSWSCEQIAARVGLSEAAVVQHLVAAALACMRAAIEPLEYPTVAMSNASHTRAMERRDSVH